MSDEMADELHELGPPAVHTARTPKHPRPRAGHGGVRAMSETTWVQFNFGGDREAQSKREAACPGHCDHDTGITYTTNPPQYQTQCCHCGRVAVRVPDAPTLPEGHGPYFPKLGRGL